MEKIIKPKPFKQLRCSDNYMFAKVMEDEETCRKVLEVLLDIKIDRLTYPEPEKSLFTGPDATGVRLDVHTSDDNRDFDIEIQTTVYSELRERSRYYQDIMDLDYLQKGHRYSELKDNIVIFICLDDLFKKGLPVYTFENICRENNSIKLQDRTMKVFYNCSKWKDIESKEKSELLKFLLTDKPETDLCKRLKEREAKIKMTAREYKEYMDYCDLVDSSRQEGYEQGKEENALAIARNMLIENVSEEAVARYTGLSPEKVSELAESVKCKT